MSDISLRGLPSVAYYRASSAKQEMSIPDQRAEAELLAGRTGACVVASFEDFARPGSLECRAGLEAMLAFVRARPKAARVQVILVTNADRFSRRDMVDAMASIKHFRDAGVRWLATPAKVFDLRADMDLVQYGFEQQLGKRAYSRSIGETVARRAREAARAGLWPGGRAPHGYVISPSTRRLELEPRQAKVMRRIFRELLAGRSLGEVAEGLNRDKVPGPGRGLKREKKDPAKGEWCRETLHKMATDRVYAGVFEWPKTHQGKYAEARTDRVETLRGHDDSRRYVKSDEGERFVFEGHHPAIVSAEDQARLVEMLAGRRWRRTTPVAGGEWVLSGLAHCCHCGARLCGRTETITREGRACLYRRLFCPRRGRQGASVCPGGSVMQDKVVAALVEEVPAWFKEPDRLAELEQQLAELTESADSAREDELARLGDEIAKISANIDVGSVNLLLISPDLRPRAEAKLREWEAERQALVSRREEVAAESQASEGGRRAVAAALQQLAGLKGAVRHASPQSLRGLFEVMLERVIVHFGTEPSVEITFRPELAHLLPSPSRRASPRRSCGTFSCPRSTSAST
jgi:DNA invertase Pin-like site-specific DNA recombinase